MNALNIKLPLSLANLGIPLRFLDTSSFFNEAVKYLDGLYKTEDNKEYMELTPEQPYTITYIDVIGQEVSIAILEDYYHRLMDAGILGTISVAFFCDISPNVVNPLWTVNAVKSHYLAVTAQIVADDFLVDTAESSNNEVDDSDQISMEEIVAEEE